MKPPIPIWGASIGLSTLGLLTGVVLGGSLVGYGAGLIGTVMAFLSLYVNRSRQMDNNYDYGYPWFQKATSAAYILGVATTLVHIVRYAIELGNA